MQSVLQKWGSGIFSFLIALLTGVSALSISGSSITTALQVIPIVVTGAVTWIIPLGTGKWPGVFKTGLDIIAIIAVILIPLTQSTPWPWSMATWILIGIAVLKASATELGIQARLDPGVSSGTTTIVNGPTS